jgi:hypothetical protein
LLSDDKLRIIVKYCTTVPRVKVLQTARCDLRFQFAHLRHEMLQLALNDITFNRDGHVTG